MSTVLVRNHASSADADPQVIPLTGKTDGRDLWLLAMIPATPDAVPSPWVEHASQLTVGGGAYTKLWRLPAAANTSAITSVTIGLNAPAPIAAVIWEETEPLEAGTLYASIGSLGPTGGPPALWGTGLHTFPARDQTFAWFASVQLSAGPFDLVSYDSGYAELGDSGLATATSQPPRVWVAQNDATAMTSGGVTATANGAVPGDAAHASGMIAYDTVAPTGPVLARTPAALTFAGVAGGAAPATQTIDVSNTGISTLSFTVSDDAAWLSVTPGSGTAPQTLTVTANPAALGAGTHTATITITASGAGDSPQTVAVTFNVSSGTSAPANTVAPAASGTASLGATLTCTSGTWTGTPTPTYAYQWQRDGANISGATAATRVVQAADEGHTLRCVVTATNTAGSASANSNGIAILAPGKLTIAAENALAGESLPQVTISGAGDLANIGFARPFSLNVGNTVQFCCAGAGTVIDIYRIGWYGGSGWHKVTTITNTPATQPAPTTVAGSNSSKTCSNWTATASWAVPGVATPGLYVGVFRSSPGPNASYIPFVVRDDDRPADIMLKLSDSTWALAYNYFDTMAAPVGGKSYYGSSGPMAGGIANRGHYATYEKPIVTRHGIDQTYWLNAEAPLIRFLERSGYNVNYSASRDWREAPTAPTLADCEVYISSGHDEYWSVGMRNKWEALRDAGKHLLFMSGNEVFWRTRYGDELGQAGNGSEMWCFKDTMDGPGGHVGGVALDPVSWTGTWRDTRWSGREPDNELTGTLFGLNGLNALAPVVPAAAAEASHPFWRHTTVDASGFTGGAGLVGFEADHMAPTEPAAQRAVLAQTTYPISGNLSDADGQDYTESGDLTWGIVSQRFPSGAVVVGFGTCQWAWGLDATHDRGSNIESSVVQQAQMNLLADLGVAAPATPIAGRTVPTPVSREAYGALPIGGARAHLLLAGAWHELEWAT